MVLDMFEEDYFADDADDFENFDDFAELAMFDEFGDGMDEDLYDDLDYAYDFEDEEDAFIGALLPLAAKFLPTIASTVMPAVTKWAGGLFRSGSRQLIQKAPQILRQATSMMRRIQPAIQRNPGIASRILTQSTRPYYMHRRPPMYPGYYPRHQSPWYPRRRMRPRMPHRMMCPGYY